MLIGLEQNGEITHGVAHFPALRETVSAGVGEGCYLNGMKTHTSDQTNLSDSLLCTTSPSRLEELIGRTKYDTITNAFGIYRGWGDCWGHILVATGRAEAMLDARMAIWDAAPLGVIVEEAGGCSFDFKGRRTIEGGSLISCAPGIAEEIKKLMEIDA